jgi:hypothetical protein
LEDGRGDDAGVAYYAGAAAVVDMHCAAMLTVLPDLAAALAAMRREEEEAAGHLPGAPPHELHRRWGPRAGAWEADMLEICPRVNWI